MKAPEEVATQTSREACLPSKLVGLKFKDSQIRSLGRTSGGSETEVAGAEAVRDSHNSGHGHPTFKSQEHEME